MTKKKLVLKDVKYRIPFKKRVSCIHIDSDKGVVFTTDDNEDYAYKCYINALGIIEKITFEEL